MSPLTNKQKFIIPIVGFLLTQSALLLESPFKWIATAMGLPLLFWGVWMAQKRMATLPEAVKKAQRRTQTILIAIILILLTINFIYVFYWV